MRIITQTLIVLLMFWSGNAAAQSTASAPASSPASALQSNTLAGPGANADQAGGQRIALLEAQLQTMRDYHSSLLDTVYFALAGVLLLASLLVGFGWFANFKVYERDKLALKTELDAATAKALAELKAEIDTRAANTAKELRSESVASSQALSEAVNKQVDGYRNELSALVSSTQRSLEARLSELARKHLVLHRTYLQEKMKSNPSSNMAMTDALSLLELVRGDSDYTVSDTLSFMLKTIDKGGKLTADEITRLHKVFDALPSHYQTLVEKVRAKVVASDLI